MRLRLILLTFIAFAMALAPLAMPVGEAMATPASHHQMKSGHCPEAPKPSHHNQADGSCCVAGCMALAALPVPTDEPALHGATVERPGADQFRRGYLGEIATPPPRLA